MVAMYTIAGRQVGSHVLAIATLGTVFTLTTLSVGGKKKTETTPPIQASSSDEDKFVREFLANAEVESKANH